MTSTWLLTNTTYGTWLPGHSMGFIGHVSEHREGDDPSDRRVVHNATNTPYDVAIPALEAHVLDRMTGQPIHLTGDQAQVAIAQFQETASFRKWQLLAVAVMFNHFHIVITADTEVDPSKILGDFKSWVTRRLTKEFGEPKSKTWWTSRGSKRELPDEAAVQAATVYVLQKQPNPLALFPTIA